MDVNSLAHTKWECKYHIVFAPKYRRQVIINKYERMQEKFQDHYAEEKEQKLLKQSVVQTIFICWCEFHPNIQYQKQWDISKEKVRS